MEGSTHLDSLAPTFRNDFYLYLAFLGSEIKLLLNLASNLASTVQVTISGGSQEQKQTVFHQQINPIFLFPTASNTKVTL